MMTLGDLTTSVLYRLGDPLGAIWSRAEAQVHLQNGYQDAAQQHRMFWDWVYLENLPSGFSCTALWEVAYLAQITAGFDFGVANYTMDDELELLHDEPKRLGPANHTCPAEGTDGWLSVIKADTSISATADVPDNLTALDRVTWDKRGIDGMSPRLMQQVDARYELTAGEVYGFMWAKDGIRTLRKVRVPSAAAATATVNGSWGAMRNVSDLTGDTVTGSWGVPRRIPSHHPMGPGRFGAARRPFLDGTNVRLEHHRLGRPMDIETDVCELPDRYALYLRDYAQAKLLARRGPGQDMVLAAHFQQRWVRDVARLDARRAMVQHERVSILGGDGNALTTRPPRPQLPWAYGSRVN